MSNLHCNYTIKQMNGTNLHQLYTINTVTNKWTQMANKSQSEADNQTP